MTDIFFYILDACIIGVLVYRVIMSRKVTCATKAGYTKYIAIGFIAFGIISLCIYKDLFNRLQSVVWIIIGLSFAFVKSGICDDGICIQGAFYPVNKIKEVADEKDGNHLRLRFLVGKRSYYIFYHNEDAQRLSDAVQDLKTKM